MSNFCENSANILQMSQNLQKFAKFQKNQLDNLVDFEKCCKTRIFLQKSVPIQPKTSDILPKLEQELLFQSKYVLKICLRKRTSQGFLFFNLTR